MDKNITDQENLQEKVLHKVILLYICAQIDDLNRSELMKIALSSMYMNYFQFSAVLNDLLEEQLLMASQRKKDTIENEQAEPRYSISAQGQAVLKTLSPQLPSAVLVYLEKAISEYQVETKYVTQTPSSYSLKSNGAYEVRLSLQENNNEYLILRLELPTKELAQAAIRKWPDLAGQFYPQLLEALWPEKKGPAKQDLSHQE